MPALTHARLSSENTISVFTNILAAFAVALGVVAMATTLWMVVHTYSPVLFGDQWELIRTLVRNHGHLGPRDLWAQHNEHRIVTGRLLEWTDLSLFSGRNVTLLVEIVAFQLCHLALLLFVIRRFGSLPRGVYATVAGFWIYCLFSPIQIENFIWGFQTVFVLTSLAATACFVAALCHAQRIANDGDVRRWGYLLGAVFFAWLAEITDAHGLLTWFVLLFAAFALRFSRREKAVIALAASVAIAVYMKGYQSPNSEATVTDALKQPGKVLHFVVTYLGRSWDGHLPNPSAWPSFSESLTTLAIVMTLVWAVQCLRRSHTFPPLQIALIGNLLFVLGTAVITAFGRLQYGGLLGATAIRYETPALIFWGSLVTLVALRSKWNRGVPPLAAQAVLVMLMVDGGGRWLDMGRVAEARQFVEEIGWNAIVEGRFDDTAALAGIFYEPGLLRDFSSYLRARHWGPAGEITSFARLQNAARPPQLQGYRVEPQACVGHWDGVRRSGLTRVSVRGWALSQAPDTAPTRVAFAAENGKIIGYAALKDVRADVVSRYPDARNVKTGWEQDLDVPGPGLYHVFLFEDTGAACPIEGELRVAHYPAF